MTDTQPDAIESAKDFMDATGLSDLVRLNHSVFLADLEQRDAAIEARARADERARVIEVMRRVVDAHDTHAQRLGSYCMLYIVDEVTSALATERDEGNE